MELVALRHLRRKGAGPRIEKGSEFDDSESTMSADDLLSKGFARKVEEEPDTEPLRDELYEKAQKLGIKGRSSMTKDELAAAVADPANIDRWRKDQKLRGRSE